MVAWKSAMSVIVDMKADPPLPMTVSRGIDTEDILFCTPRLCLAVPSSIVIIDTLLADASPASIGEIER